MVDFSQILLHFSSKAKAFPMRIIWNSVVPTKVGFFYMGSFLSIGFDFGSITKDRVVFGEPMSFM